jgi:hypothetical protein
MLIGQSSNFTERPVWVLTKQSSPTQPNHEISRISNPKHLIEFNNKAVGLHSNLILQIADFNSWLLTDFPTVKSDEPQAA